MAHIAYTGMGLGAAKEVLALATKLWPRWKNTPELNGEWVKLLANHPRDVAEAVVRSHVAEQVGSPSMPKIAAKLTAARQQALAELAEKTKATKVEDEPRWPPRHWGDVQYFHREHPAMVERWLDNECDEYEAARYRKVCGMSRAELWAGIKANFCGGKSRKAGGTSWSQIQAAAEAASASQQSN